MDLRQSMQALRVYFGVLVACTAIGALSAFLVSSQLPKVYEARATLIAQSMAQTYAEIAVSRPVLEQVISELGVPTTPEALAGSVDATASKTSALLTVSARDTDPSRAAAIANAVANRLVQLAPDISGASTGDQGAVEADLATVQAQIQQTEAAISVLSDRTTPTAANAQRLQTLQTQLAALLAVQPSLLNIAASYSQVSPSILAAAVPPTNVSSPPAIVVTVLGGLAGLAIGVGIVLLVGHTRRPSMPSQA